MKKFSFRHVCLTGILIPMILAGGSTVRGVEEREESASSIPGSTVNETDFQPKLIGVTRLSGKMRDRSGLEYQLNDGSPANLFGGISAMDRIGQTNQYIAVSDRGPQDGQVDYFCRWHVLTIDIDPTSNSPVNVQLEKTVLMHDEFGENFVGLASANDVHRGKGPCRLDPEGVRMGANDTVWISDEYGPNILHFSADGHLLSSVAVPVAWHVAVPSSEAAREVSENQRGRIPNCGLEGLAISPDGNTLFGLMQSPLLQDSTIENGYARGQNCRMLAVHTDGSDVHEYVYHLDNASYKLNEILWLDENEFLVIERDGIPGREAKCKSIVRIRLEEVTDVVNTERLPCFELGNSIRSVTKHKLLDLTEPQFGLAGDAMPEKIESLAWGPEINGRKTLIVASDNDFIEENDTMIYVFSL